MSLYKVTVLSGQHEQYSIRHVETNTVAKIPRILIDSNLVDVKILSLELLGEVVLRETKFNKKEK